MAVFGGEHAGRVKMRIPTLHFRVRWGAFYFVMNVDREPRGDSEHRGSDRRD